MTTQFTTLFPIDRQQEFQPVEVKKDALSLLANRKTLKTAVKALSKYDQNQVTKARRTLGKEIRGTQRQYIAIDPAKIAQTAMELNSSATIPVGLIGLSLLKNAPMVVESAKNLVIDWTLEQFRQEQLKNKVETETAELDVARFASLETGAREAAALDAVRLASVKTATQEAAEDALLEEALLASLQTPEPIEVPLPSAEETAPAVPKEVLMPSFNSAPVEQTKPAVEPEKVKEVPVEKPVNQPELPKKESAKNEQSKKSSSWWGKFIGFFKAIFSGIASLFSGRKKESK